MLKFLVQLKKKQNKKTTIPALLISFFLFFFKPLYSQDGKLEDGGEIFTQVLQEVLWI